MYEIISGWPHDFKQLLTDKYFIPTQSVLLFGKRTYDCMSVCIIKKVLMWFLFNYIFLAFIIQVGTYSSDYYFG